jgi:pimeloyl-ACP methyl ester carboxylesterase
VLDSALAATSLSWSEIQPRLAEWTRVVSYDRAGFGWSDASPVPRTVENMVEELDQLLSAADVEPPYVLVGHSFGGWVAQLYASRHRSNVCGLILVDSPHPRTWKDPDAAQASRVVRGARLARRAAWCARFGWMRLMFLLERVRVFGEHGRVAELLGKTPLAIRRQLRTFWVQPKTLEALASQIENAPASAAKVFEETSELGEMPLVVLTAANPDSTRLDDQLQTTALSRSGRHVIASGSGHWIPLEEPELIVDAVRDVLDLLDSTR